MSTCPLASARPAFHRLLAKSRPRACLGACPEVRHQLVFHRRAAAQERRVQPLPANAWPAPRTGRPPRPGLGCSLLRGRPLRCARAGGPNPSLNPRPSPAGRLARAPALVHHRPHGQAVLPPWSGLAQTLVLAWHHRAHRSTRLAGASRLVNLSARFGKACVPLPSRQVTP